MIIRSLWTALRHSTRPRVGGVAEPTLEHFRVGFRDVDLFRHLNHARYLNYMEVARWAMLTRSGFLRLALRHGWIAPLRSLHVEYYRPLRLRQRFQIHTQFVRFEQRWFFILHRVFSEDTEMARALIQGTVRKGRENVSPDEYLSPLGFNSADARVPTDIAEWINRRMQALDTA